MSLDVTQLHALTDSYPCARWPAVPQEIGAAVISNMANNASTVPVVPTACANWTTGATICTNEATRACANCQLVVYCGRDCQVSHWTEHKKACKCPLSKSTWRPAWDRELRNPSWATGPDATNLHNPFGVCKYLWGNAPALDILRLKDNEGLDYGQDIALLFAASGDLRNVVKSIADLPSTFKQNLNITLNDREFDVVARNAIILLFTLACLDEETPTAVTNHFLAECLIHIWYSAFIPATLQSSLQYKVQPLISDVCARIVRKDEHAVLGKTWRFASGRKMRLVLRKEEWLKLDKFLTLPCGLTPERARTIRAATTLAPERRDYRDRWHQKEATPAMRIAKQRFREDGLVLPFGHPRVGFNIPNPTLFQNPNAWPMDDLADPLSGWPVMAVHDTPSRAANDEYGKLFTYLQEQFRKFLDRLQGLQARLELLHVDVTDLPRQLAKDKYVRIEVSNISDHAYLGTRETLRLLSPLLQDPQENPHATLVTLYLNAVMEVIKASDNKATKDNLNMEVVLKYLPNISKSALPMPQGADMYQIWDSRTLLLDTDKCFDLYMKHVHFQQLSDDLGVYYKKHNTVVEQWPTRLKLRLGQEGAQKEFSLILASKFSGTERYVEWKRCQK